MKNRLLDIAIKELHIKKYDGYYLSISNENLYEFTRLIDNYIFDLTGFTGDTGSILITKKNCYLYVDGRFTIQAKKEVGDPRIKVIEINRSNKRFEDISEKLGNNKKLAINPKIESISNILNAIDIFKRKNIELVFDYKYLRREFKSIKSKCFNMSSAPLFLLNKKYLSKSSKVKIRECIDTLKSDNNLKGNVSYITSNLEEIAYLSNLRYRFCDIDNHGVLFDAFLIVNDKKTVLYLKDYLEDEALKYITKSNIVIKNYDEFYKDLKKLKNNGRYYLDSRINNYYIYKCLGLRNSNIVNSPIEMDMSVKGDAEIRGLRKCNITDGVAITNVIYRIKKLKDKDLSDEYKIKQFVDTTRAIVGKKDYLCPSFETIVAFKDNAAICHYVPTSKKHKKVNGEGLLLIDSGGNYICGTTDITRTISLYKKRVPEVVKKHYSIVLESMIRLSMAKFPYGLTGFELDIMARYNLYDNYLDFNHGTGHGIGYVSNVHEGPNRIGPIVNKNYEKNVLLPYQVTSNEPGLYFENKYGIRIENDLLTIPLKENNYGEFMGFETLTLCPYDRDLIDKKYLSRESIEFINKYNKLVYKKLSRHLDKKVSEWLKKETREV